MFMARPATVGKDTLDRLVLFLTGEAQPTQFDFRRFEREAESLERIGEKGDAHTVRSAAAALQWDVDQAVNWAERAMIAEGSAVVACNASITMRYLNRCDLAAPYALQAAHLAPLDFEMVDHAVAALCADGRLSEASALADEYQKRIAGNSPQEFASRPGVFGEAAASLGISEQRLQWEIRTGLGILSEERRRHAGIGFELATEPDGGAALTVLLTFHGDHEEEMRLEAKFASLLIQEPGWNPCRLSVELQHVGQHVGEPA